MEGSEKGKCGDELGSSLACVEGYAPLRRRFFALRSLPSSGERDRRAIHLAPSDEDLNHLLLSPHFPPLLSSRPPTPQAARSLSPLSSRPPRRLSRVKRADLIDIHHGGHE
ncbi:hypothetical protein QCA50_010347 [Cerrena zonata]|uniref:Uncharacterized protein n=1 Tax=Cerrena zonata TaxID=2478898 RepID=A0AAW0G5E0_9APHY